MDLWATLCKLPWHFWWECSALGKLLREALWNLGLGRREAWRCPQRGPRGGWAARALRATAAPAVGPGALLQRVPGGGGEGGELGWAHINLDKAPTEACKTKPQQTKQQ